MGDNLLAVVKQQKVTFSSSRFAKFVAQFKPSTILKKEYKCISREKFIKAS